VVKDISAGWGTCFHTVPLNGCPVALTCWKETIAVGLSSGCIIILNAITGTQMAILSGHLARVESLIFSPDGRSLVSCSNDKTIKLWDMQTGGVVRTFQGHTDWVYSVSISADCTTIASGSRDKTIRLWDIQTGECHYTIKQNIRVIHVSFLPLDPKHFMSGSGYTIQQWDIDSQKIVSESVGAHIAYSLDGTQLVVWNESVVEVQNPDSKVIVAKFSLSNVDIECCCISPDNRLIAVAADTTIYVWDISSPDPYLLETFIGHNVSVSSLTFSSPLSRTRDLVDQIKQITIEIRDIKERKKHRIDSSRITNTINVRNHTQSGPLQGGHEEHDKDDVHYEYSIQSDHQLPGSKSTQRHYAPAQYPSPIVSTSLPPPPPELHPSLPSNENPVKPVSSTTPWSKRPNDPGSPANEGDNVGGVMGVPLCTTNGMTSGDEIDVGPCAD